MTVDCRDVHTAAHTGVRPYKACFRMLFDRCFHLMQVDRVFDPDGADVAVDRHRHIVFGCKGVDRVQGHMVGPRLFTVSQCGQVIMPGKDFANPFPQIRVHGHHALDMVDGIEICGIKTADKRMKLLLVCLTQTADSLGHENIGDAVPALTPT